MYHPLEDQWPLAIDPTNRYLFALGDDGLDVWGISEADLEFRIHDDLLDGSSQGRLLEMRFAFDNIVFSPDGSLCAISFRDRPVEVWDIERGLRRQVLRCHSIQAGLFEFGPCGRRLVAGDISGAITLFNVDNGNVIASFGDSQGSICSAFSPDGQLVIARWNIDGAELWESDSGRRLCRMKPPEVSGAEVEDVAPLGVYDPRVVFSSNGDFIVTSGRILHVWSR